MYAVLQEKKEKSFYTTLKMQMQLVKRLHSVMFIHSELLRTTCHT